ncbi:hypothetical protein BW721_05875 [Jeotgalibaca sp. PTS2502]|uniref:hypothetical protein n=1 Tax=Jeotgalibaca sp. PTS2502 TaxID=1903686 RepID=UPI000973708F|nr:hypothetical protein [Jeotgalibaca sp. PTS2502]APZ49242.1 hypothetical protein BW721_05875 [Jeotgalibaca sp. PTS2502]
MKKKLWLIPNLIVIYLSITYIMYVIGPYNWPSDNFTLLTLYLLVLFLLIIFGFYLAYRKLNGSLQYKSKGKFFIFFIETLIILNLFYQLWGIVSYTSIETLSFSNIINNLSLGLSKPGDSYYEKIGNIPIAFGISAAPWVVLAPLTYSSTPLFLYNYKTVRPLFKILGVLTILVELTRWISIGTNQGIIGVAFIFITVFLVKYLRNNLMNKSNKMISISFKKLFLRFLIFMLILFGIIFFILSISDRINSVANFHIGGIYPDMENIFVKYTPDFIGTGVILISSYLTQGYYALSMLLPLENMSMLGIGHSNFLISNFSELFNKEYFLNTYQMKLASIGWHPTIYYHTFFTWIANDVGFIGALFVVFIFSYYCGYIIKKSVYEENQLAIIILSLLLSIFFYMPSNNVVLSTPNTFMAFWVLSISMFFMESCPRIVLRKKRF